MSRANAWETAPVAFAAWADGRLSTDQTRHLFQLAEAVPDVSARVVATGVKGILNFAPMQLRVPPDVAVKDVNMVMELEALSFALSQARAAAE